MPKSADFHGARREKRRKQINLSITLARRRYAQLANHPSLGMEAPVFSNPRKTPSRAVQSRSLPSIDWAFSIIHWDGDGWDDTPDADAIIVTLMRNAPMRRKMLDYAIYGLRRWLLIIQDSLTSLFHSRR